MSAAPNGLGSCGCEGGTSNLTAGGGAPAANPGLTRSGGASRTGTRCGCDDPVVQTGPSPQPLLGASALSDRNEVWPGLHVGGRPRAPAQLALDAGIPIAGRSEPGVHRSKRPKANLIGNPSSGKQRGRYVDIYLSAGPRENYAFPLPVNYRSCNQDNTANCSLYRIRWDHQTDTGRVSRIQGALHLNFWLTQVDIGYVQPAVSPSGEWLLYVGVATEQDAGGRRAGSSGLVVERTSGGGAEVVYSRVAGSHQPQYPAWIEDPPSGTPFLWNSATGAGQTDTATVWRRTEVLGTTRDRTSFGPDSSTLQGISFEDGNVHQDAADRSGPAVVTFGGAVGSVGPPLVPTEHIPQVSDLDGGNINVVAISSSTPALSECHHPAFNRTGDEILCTGQEPAESFGLTDGNDLQKRRRLHRFAWDGSAWTNGSPLVGALNAADFATIATDKTGAAVPGVFAEQLVAPSPDKCRNYVWKFAEFCGSDRFVVATVYCTESSDYPLYRQIRNSRVVLIDLDADDDAVGTPAAYHDLTGWIEDFEQAPAGSFNAVFSTCHSPAVAP